MPFLLIAALLLLGAPAHAASDINDLRFLGNITVLDLVARVIKTMFGFAGMAALLAFIYGGFTVMFSQGNDEAVKKGKAIVTNAAIGLIVMFFSYSALNYVIDIIGYATT